MREWSGRINSSRTSRQRSINTHAVAFLSQIAHMAHETFFKHQMVSRLDRALEKQRAVDSNWRTVCRLVNERDGYRCRVYGTPISPSAMAMRDRAHHHHIVFRSAGGGDTVENVVLISAAAHDEVHVKRTLRIEGNAEDRLTLWRMDDDGCWFVWRQETGVRQYHRD
jgi:hypothetical protein